MTVTNPHPDSEYLYIRKPDVFEDWSMAQQRIWQTIQENSTGHKRPLIIINVSQWAVDLGIARKTIQRFLAMITTPGESGSQLAFKVIREGQPNQYKIRWDFTYKRKKDPAGSEPCEHRRKAREKGGATSKVFHAFQSTTKNKEKTSRDTRPVNFNRLMFWLRDKCQGYNFWESLPSVIGEFLSKRQQLLTDKAEKLRWFFRNHFTDLLKDILENGQKIRELYRLIPEMILSYLRRFHEEVIRKRNRRTWNDESTDPINEAFPDFSTTDRESEESQDTDRSDRQATQKKKDRAIEQLAKWSGSSVDEMIYG